MICWSTAEVISVFVSASTSPLSVSTMRPPVRRPTSDSAGRGIFSTPASTSLSTSLAVSGLPAWARGSRCRGGRTSSASRAPTWASRCRVTHTVPSSKESTSSIS